jgi:hypothetical protein
MTSGAHGGLLPRRGRNALYELVFSDPRNPRSAPTLNLPAQCVCCNHPTDASIRRLPDGASESYALPLCTPCTAHFEVPGAMPKWLPVFGAVLLGAIAFGIATDRLALSGVALAFVLMYVGAFSFWSRTRLKAYNGHHLGLDLDVKSGQVTLRTTHWAWLQAVLTANPDLDVRVP